MTTELTGTSRNKSVFARIVAVAEAMATPHGVDRYTELAAPMITVRELRARVTRVHRENAHSVTLELEPTRQWRGFTAGGYVQIGVVVGGVRHTRCFSPCDSEHRADGRFTLTVKAHGDGVVSRELYDNARPGLMVDLEQAAGDFVLPRPRPHDIVLISGGSGITPVLAMARTLADERHPGRVALLHYVSGPDDLVHAAELRRLSAVFGFTVTLGFTAVGGGDVRGHFTGGHLDVAAPWARGAQAFLCGPPALMEAVRGEYAERGLADSLHTEEFTLAIAPPADDETGGTVRFSESGVEADDSGAVLLEQAEAAGLTPDYGCRMGICFSCTATRRSGCTRNEKTGEVGSEPDQPIQLCVSRPVGDVDIAV